MKLKNKELKGLYKSFHYAFRGLWFCITNERNMRIHIASSALVLLFSYIYGLSPTEYAVLIITLGLVITCEALNTALESLVDLGSDAYDNLARIAKDVAASAVLICAISSVGVGLVLFLHPDKLVDAFTEIIKNPLYIALFLVLIIFGLLFIFRGLKPVNHKEDIKLYEPKINKTSNNLNFNDDEQIKIYKGK